MSGKPFDHLSADPPERVLRSLWYISPPEMRRKACEANAGAQDEEVSGPEAAQVNICTPHVATLPDGSTVNLPAGTVLRESTAEHVEARLRVLNKQRFLEIAVIEAACEMASLLAPGISKDIDRMLLAVQVMRTHAAAQPPIGLTVSEAKVPR